MALQRKVGSFLTGAIGSGSIPVSGLGFKPQVVYFLTTRQDAADYAAGFQMAFGWGAQQDDASYVQAAQQWGGYPDNVNGTNPTKARRGGYWSRCLVLWDDDGGGRTIDLTFASCDTDGFTLTKNYNTLADVRVYYLALAGLSGVKGGTFAAETGQTPPHDQPHVDVGWEPSLVTMLFPRRATEGNTTDMQGSLGFGQGPVGSPLQWVISPGARHGQTVAANQLNNTYLRTDRIIWNTSTSGGTSEAEANFKGTDGTGFTITWDKYSGTASAVVPWLALKGCQVKVGTFGKRTSTGDDNPDVGILVKALLLASRHHVASTTQHDDANLSLGIADGTNSRTIGSVGKDVTIASSSGRFNLDTKVLRLATPATSGGGTPATDAEATASFPESGKFRLSWNPCNAQADEIAYVALGDVPGPAKGEVTVIGP